jgi:hypothetical protein
LEKPEKVMLIYQEVRVTTSKHRSRYIRPLHLETWIKTGNECDQEDGFKLPMQANNLKKTA